MEHLQKEEPFSSDPYFSLTVEAELGAFTEIKNWAVLLLNIFYHINFNLNVKNYFEECLFYKPMSCSADCQ